MLRSWQYLWKDIYFGKFLNAWNWCGLLSFCMQMSLHAVPPPMGWIFKWDPRFEKVQVSFDIWNWFSFFKIESLELKLCVLLVQWAMSCFTLTLNLGCSQSWEGKINYELWIVIYWLLPNLALMVCVMAAWGNGVENTIEKVRYNWWHGCSSSIFGLRGCLIYHRWNLSNCGWCAIQALSTWCSNT